MKSPISPAAAANRSAPSVSAPAFLLLHGTLLLYAVVSVFGKLAGNSLAIHDTQPTLLFMALEFLSLTVYAVLWQQTLRRMPLSFAYSNKAVCTLWSCLFGISLFGETLTWGKAIGIAVVLVGVWLVVSDHE